MSLELTRLIPLALAGAGKTYDAAMRLARDLQSSGSDIVIEDDLAELFGRAQIKPELERSFKTVVSRPENIKPLSGTIRLYSGPGPSVIRALKDQPYFATIVQCSFLTALHTKDALAASIARFFEKRQQEASGNWAARATPSLDGIRGTLQAYEDQTCSFNWRILMLAVAKSLELKEHQINDRINEIFLEGLATTLPLVQRFPEEHFLSISTGYSVCAIVVWAHHILGLSVLVKLLRTDGKFTTTSKEVRFGSGGAINVVVDVHAKNVNSGENTPTTDEEAVTLQSCSNKDVIFRLKAEDDSEFIDSNNKGPLKGVGNRVLEQTLAYRHGRSKVTQELKHISCALAICISRRLCISKPSSDGFRVDEWGMMQMADLSFQADEHSLDLSEPTEQHMKGSKLYIPVRRIMDAAQLIFDTVHWDTNLIEDFAALFDNKALNDVKDPPRSIAVHLHEWNVTSGLEKGSTWPALWLEARRLSLVILAFAHVTNLSAAADLPVSERLGSIHSSCTFVNLSIWNGRAALSVEPWEWFELICILLQGAKDLDEIRKDICLVSNYGWSLFLNTFGDADASSLYAQNILIKPGIPWRNGIWKHRVVDGPEISDRILMTCNGVAGDKIGLSPHLSTEQAPTQVGERGDSFVVTVQLKTKPMSRKNVGGVSGPTPNVHRTGYRQLWTALSPVRHTNPCSHDPTLPNTLSLSPGWSLIEGFAKDATLKLRKWNMFATAANSAARWRALLSVFQNQDFNSTQIQNVVLRGPDCCLDCAMEQTSKQDGEWYLIL